MGRHILTGTLCLLLAVVWAMAFLYQRNNVGFLMNVSLAADAPAVFRLTSIWSLLQIWIPALLVLPVAIISVWTMFGAKPVARLLRVGVAVTAILSIGVLVGQAGYAAVRVSAGQPASLPNPTINNELLFALVTLGLQLSVLALLRTPGSNNDLQRGSSVARASDNRQTSDSAPRTSHLDSRLGHVAREV